MAADNVIMPERWNDRWKREELLARRPRVRRTRELYHDLQVELAHRYRYPYRLGALPDGIEVHYRRGRWWNINERVEDRPPDEGECDDRLRIRQTVAWIYKAGVRVGAIEFAEYDVPVAFDEEFCAITDDHDLHLAILAEHCCAAWDAFTMEVSAYGYLVELKTVWIEPRTITPGEWRPILDRLISKFEAKGSLLLSQVFPLEYTGLAGPEDLSRVGFTRRRTAMIAWCEKHLGLRRFPGPPGEEGWMWRPFERVAKHIDDPHYNPDWRRSHAW